MVESFHIHFGYMLKIVIMDIQLKQIVKNLSLILNISFIKVVKNLVNPVKI